MKFRKKTPSRRITDTRSAPFADGERVSLRELGPPQLDDEVLEALAHPRTRRRRGEPEILEFGRGKYVYTRISRHDGSAEVFRFRREAEALEAMRIAMQVDVLAASDAPRD